MNLARILELQAAQGESQFVSHVREIFQYNYVPLPIILGAKQVELNVTNQKILLTKPLKAIKVVDYVGGDDRKSGHYQDNVIFIRENTALRLTCLQTFIHEFGHHLDDNWLRGTLPRDAAKTEYNKEKDRVQQMLGKDISQDEFDSDYKELLRIGTDAITMYSLRTDDEWMAESFALYFSGYGDVLSQKHPATFTAIENLCKGTM